MIKVFFLIPNIKHIFFDLDRTLWDFEANSFDQIMHMYAKFELSKYHISLPLEFIKVYKKCNDTCWDLYLKGLLSQTELRIRRFQDTLNYFGVFDEKLAQSMSVCYVKESPYRTQLIPYSTEILNYLKNKGYRLHIITNGFEEVQMIKLKQCNLLHFFSTVVTSEMASAKKPSTLIFDFALTKAAAQKHESIYIGDDILVDVKGALDAGWQAVYFNPHKKNHNICTFFDICSLIELKSIL